MERHESTEGLPGDFFSGISVNALRALAPSVDGAIEGDAQDGVLGRFKKSSEQMLAGLTMRHGKRTIFQEGGMYRY